MKYLTEYTEQINGSVNYGMFKRRMYHKTLESAVRFWRSNIFHLVYGKCGFSLLAAFKGDAINLPSNICGTLTWVEAEEPSFSGLAMEGNLTKHDLKSQTKLRALLQNLLDEEHELRERPFRESTNPF